MLICDNKKKRKEWDEIVSIIAKWVFVVSFVFATIYLIYYSAGHGTEENIPEHVMYLKNWSCRIDGGQWSDIELPCSLEVENGATVEYKTKLPNNLEDNMWLATLNSRDFIVTIDGENRYNWDRGEVKFPGGPVKSIYMFVPIMKSDSGKELIIIKHGMLNNGTMINVLVGDSFSVMDELQRSTGRVKFAVSILIFILAIILLSVSLTLKLVYKQEIPLILLSMGAMSTAAWLVLDSNLFQIVFRVRYIDGFLTYIMTLIMLFPYLLYIDMIQNHRYRKIYAFVAIVELFNFLICTVLHLCNVVSFIDMLKPLNFIIAWIVVILLVCIVIDICVHKVRNYVIVAFGVLGFGLMAIIEIISINTRQIRKFDGLFMLTGLFILMTMAAIQQAKDIYQAEIKKRETEQDSIAQQHFLTNMSHEIRTPINTILGMNEMILCENASDEIKQYAERISHSGKLLLSLINDVIDFSMYKTDKEEIENEPYDIKSLVDDVIDVLKNQTMEKGLGCNIGLSADIPARLLGDPKRIMRVLNNIVSNAVKYTDKGSITFSFECEKLEEGYELEFTISDTGRGIRQEDFETIFEPFVRSDIRKNRSIDGTGLGLAITKEIVEKMGGTIEVDSTLGKGSTFTVRLPQGEVEGAERITVEYCSKLNLPHEVVRPKESSDDKEDAKKEVTKDTCACVSYEAPEARVLAVDDNNSNLIVIKEFLKSTKLQLELAGGGQEAIYRCSEFKYDIILMDHMMPDPDGIAALHAIKENPESINKDTPVVVLTANAVGDCKDEYLNEGFADYLSKPVSRKDLLDTIRQLIDPNLIIEHNDEYAEQKDSVTIEPQADIKGEECDIIDFVALLKRFDNQESVVDMVLSECVKEGTKKLTLLRELYDNNDISRYAVEAHGVKGVMASICANDISQRAKNHEFAAKENRIEFITEDIDGFLEQYKEVLEYITEYLGKKGIEIKKPRISEVAGELDTVESIKAQIEEALDEFDADKALNYIDKLGSIVGEDKIALVEEIRGYADDFQYDLAKDSLEKI